MQVTQETLSKSFNSRTCSYLKRDPQTEQLLHPNLSDINSLLLEEMKDWARINW